MTADRLTALLNQSSRDRSIKTRRSDKEHIARWVHLLNRLTRNYVL